MTYKQEERKNILDDFDDNSRISYVDNALVKIASPIQIDLTKLFSSKISILSDSYFNKDSVIGVDIRVTSRIYSVIGKVSNVKDHKAGYEIELVLEYIPALLLKELEEIVPFSTMIDEVNL
jgi:hypothetical protein